ncbi:TRAP transporter small permease [Subdoligranulum variabile]|uniref:TRAP transporter, DctQ-like membrane protein n=1 Tax=Subdoligranulum variabile DSM 15176 TaxID=411471 RepID=D1PIK2_9FIRM|nr:TRAP transporter small permease [Subdoligranulum variabile]EFB77361.1 TRAP transporter, DctQ-like membrane protein [Subdoligranulum variabile DSM 15176]UWP67258.1 TRAP transporter small permease [Subdoligranulum variabile]
MIELMTKIRRGINALLSTIAAIILITMSVLVIYQVFTRYVLNNPADFTEEIIRYLLIWICFIGAAYAFNSRQHMALLFVQAKMKPAARRALVIFSDVLVLLFAIFVMVMGGINLAVSARQEFSSLLGIPRSLVYAMAPIAGVFTIVAQIINLVEDFTGIEIK